MWKAKGQTIIEVLVVLAVVSIGLFASAGLVIGNLSLVERDTDRVIAINLAREGIEIAKQIRDSNWLAGQDFDTGLVNATTPGDYTASLVWDGVISTPSFDFSTDAISDANAQVVLSTEATASGVYANQNTVPPISGKATAFKRLITFSPICVDASNVHTVISSGLCTDIGQVKAGIRIESRIEWLRKGSTISSVIYEDLYDWK
ncbi:prepilin-type N-terminal cleavage/methylation domain-containing protein [Candidatus Uhrbacteria bacterium]|nr:prepilin-type N-terminal cleavage/methylation domain-containing protein [Candidatus Uhrbacteria bacterium]